MLGKDFLNQLPQDVKGIIVNLFGSLDGFYVYVLRLNELQYKHFKETNEMDVMKIERLKDLLVKNGMDSILADDLVDEIGGDFDETVASSFAKKLLGPNWEKIIDGFEKQINGL